MRGRADHPAAPALAGLVLALAVVAVALARSGGGPEGLVRAGTPFADPAAVPAGLPVTANGYDGMFYYRLALDPLTDRADAHGIAFDVPAYRQQRIVYPVLAWLVALGDPARTPFALVAVNVAAMAAIGWIGGVLARQSGRHALWGAAFPLWPGTFVTLANDLTELVAAAFLLAGLALLRRERPGLAAIPLTLAVLARETTVIAAGALGMARAWGAPSAPRRWIALALPVAALAASQLVLAARWQRTVPAQEGVAALWPPLVGIIGAAWANGERLAGVDAAFWTLSTLFVLATVAIGAWGLRTLRGGERAAWAAYLALALVLQPNIWANAGLLRTLTELGVLTALAAIAAGPRARTAFVASEAAVYAAYLALGPAL